MKNGAASCYSVVALGRATWICLTLAVSQPNQPNHKWCKPFEKEAINEIYSTYEGRHKISY